MPDYRCPSCDGGFPASDADGACPWCGEEMDGGYSPRPWLPGDLPPSDVGEPNPPGQPEFDPTQPLQSDIQPRARHDFSQEADE